MMQIIQIEVGHLIKITNNHTIQIKRIRMKKHQESLFLDRDLKEKEKMGMNIFYI